MGSSHTTSPLQVMSQPVSRHDLLAWAPNRLQTWPSPFQYGLQHQSPLTSGYNITSNNINCNNNNNNKNSSQNLLVAANLLPFVVSSLVVNGNKPDVALAAALQRWPGLPALTGIKTTTSNKTKNSIAIAENGTQEKTPDMTCGLDLTLAKSKLLS